MRSFLRQPHDLDIPDFRFFQRNTFSFPQSHRHLHREFPPESASSFDTTTRRPYRSPVWSSQTFLFRTLHPQDRL
ncbi:MAG: hypothetical protein MJ058_04220 [Akkermansia sp.]|nr:hypothetical protein [Akkermansia sp.]